MPLFRRKAAPAPPDAKALAEEVAADAAAAAERFWARWTELLPEISAALGDGEPHRFESDLATAVLRLHPNLHFSIEHGERAIYALVISGQEDPELRPITDAWKAAAPPDDAIWEYHDSVPPVPDPTGVTVNIGPHRLDLADVRVAAQVDEAEGVVDVAVHHPEMTALGDEASVRAMTFLPLDAALGERLAGERLGRVETALAEPASSIGLLELRELVLRLTGSPPDPGDHRDGGA